LNGVAFRRRAQMAVICVTVDEGPPLPARGQQMDPVQ
jgi:hypothetical protein